MDQPISWRRLVFAMVIVLTFAVFVDKTCFFMRNIVAGVGRARSFPSDWWRASRRMSYADLALELGITLWLNTALYALIGWFWARFHHWGKAAAVVCCLLLFLYNHMVFASVCIE